MVFSAIMSLLFRLKMHVGHAFFLAIVASVFPVWA